MESDNKIIIDIESFGKREELLVNGMTNLLQNFSNYQKLKYVSVTKDICIPIPKVLVLFCPKCANERTFRSNSSWPTLDYYPDLYTLPYSCTHCTADPFKYEFYLRWEEGLIYKVGQYPERDIKIPTKIRKLLGDDVDFYRKALICHEHSYGLGSYIYLRRIFENKINDMLKAIGEISEEQRITGVEEKISKVLKQRDLESKLELAAKIAPPSLMIEGMNPFKIIWGNLSKGVHELLEDECNDMFNQLKGVFDYLLEALFIERDKRKELVVQLKSLADKKRKK